MVGHSAIRPVLVNCQSSAWQVSVATAPILVKLILLDFIHVVGFFLFVLKLHQLHKDGVNNARINLRDISGGRVYLMCLPRLSCVREPRKEYALQSAPAHH